MLMLIKKLRTFSPSSMAENPEVAPLKDLVLKQVIKDIGRHSIKYHTAEDITPYLILQRNYGDKLLENALKINSVVRESEENSALSSLISNFLFNGFTQRIELSGEDFNENNASVISQNCKHLLHLSIHGTRLFPEICASLFNSVRQLTVLNLRECEQLNVTTVRIISTSLIHLKSLDLSETSINDDTVYVLCGHCLPFEDFSQSGCCYTKNCAVISGLKLEHLNISNICRTRVTEPAIACLLTHIPTLRKIILTNEDNSILSFRYVTYRDTGTILGARPQIIPFTLESVVCSINASRAKHLMPSLTFQLEDVNTNLCVLPDSRTFLGYFPYLKKLTACVKQPQLSLGGDLDEALTDHDLQHLEEIKLLFPTTRDIFTSRFQSFWETKGHQLIQLTLNTEYSPSTFSYKEFRGIVGKCPNLHILRVYAENLVEAEKIEDFPYLPKLKQLALNISGEDTSVKDVYHKVLASSKKVSVLNLTIPCSTIIFFHSLLTKENFPFLTSRTIVI